MLKPQSSPQPFSFVSASAFRLSLYSLGAGYTIANASECLNYTSIDPKQQRQSEFSFLADPFLAPNLPRRHALAGLLFTTFRPASRHGMGNKGRQGEIKEDKAKSSQPSIQTCHGRQMETRGDKERQRTAQHPDFHGRQRETRGDKERQRTAQHPDMPRDKGRQGETKQSHLSQHPDTPWETRGDKGTQSQIISAQHPDMPWETRGWETRGSEGIQSKIFSAQHPDMPWEPRGQRETGQDKAKSSQPSIQTRHGRQGETKGGNHLGPASFPCKN